MAVGSYISYYRVVEKKAKERLLIELERNTTSTPYSSTSYYTKDEKMSDELHSFSFEIIAAATNNFHSRVWVNHSYILHGLLFYQKIKQLNVNSYQEK